MSSTEGKVINCRAAVLWKEGTPLKVENITIDPPKAGEVRVRNIASGVCATDLHFVKNEPTDYKPDFNGLPVVLGHEGGSVVESIGEGVKGLEIGDKVIPLSLANCEKCALCLNPKTNLCVQVDPTLNLYHGNYETRMKINGKPLLSLGGISTFAEYSVIRESQICKINRKTNLTNACIIGCAVATAFGSVTSIAEVHSGSTCAIWGLGAIGLSAVLACKQAGAKDIICMDTNSDKRNFAEQFGCTEFINPKELDKPLDEYLKSKGGIDYAFDCIGNIEVLKTGLKSLNPWGAQIVVGLPPRGHKLEVPIEDLLKGRKVQGGFLGNKKTRKHMQELTEKYVNGDLPIDPLITHRFKLDQINDAFELLKAGKSVRSVIQY